MADYFDLERYQQDFYRNQAMSWRADINDRLSALVLPNGVGGSTPVGSTTPFLPYGYDFQDYGTVSTWLSDRIGRDLMSVATGYDALGADELGADEDVPEVKKMEQPDSEKPSVLETILTNIVKGIENLGKKEEAINSPQNNESEDEKNKKMEALNEERDQYLSTFWELTRLQSDIIGYASFGKAEETRRFNDLMFYAFTVY